MPKNKELPTAFQLSAKGVGLIAAIESGLLPKITVDGAEGYDNDLFNRFWDMLLEKCSVELRE